MTSDPQLLAEEIEFKSNHIPLPECGSVLPR
jgi:hypothetical protein